MACLLAMTRLWVVGLGGGAIWQISEFVVTVISVRNWLCRVLNWANPLITLLESGSNILWRRSGTSQRFS